MKLCMVPVSRIEDRDGYAFRWREELIHCIGDEEFF